MKRLRVGTLALTLLGAALSGCMVRKGDFTVYSTRPEVLRQNRVPAGLGVASEGKDCTVVLGGVLPLAPLPRYDVAVDRAIGDKGNALINATFYYDLRIGFLYQCLRVQGEVVNLQ